MDHKVDRNDLKEEESKNIVKDDEYYSRFIVKEEKKIIPKKERKSIACLADIDIISASKRGSSTKPSKRNDYRNYKTLIGSSVSTPHNISRGDVKKPLTKKRGKAAQRVNELLKERRKQKDRIYNKDCKATIDKCINSLKKKRKDHNKGSTVVMSDLDTKRSYMKSHRSAQNKGLDHTRNLQLNSANSVSINRSLLKNRNTPYHS